MTLVWFSVHAEETLNQSHKQGRQRDLKTGKVHLLHSNQYKVSTSK